MFTILDMGDFRILEIHEDDSMRRRYFHKDGTELVHFRRKKDSKKLAAVVYGVVKVFKKPNTSTYHWEVLKHTGRALWLNVESDTDRVLDNMLEYDGDI